MAALQFHLIHLIDEDASKTKETPRLCRGGSSSLTLRKSSICGSPSVSHHAHERRFMMDDARNFKLALQLSFCLEVCALSDRLVSSAPE